MNIFDVAAKIIWGPKQSMLAFTKCTFVLLIGRYVLAGLTFVAVAVLQVCSIMLIVLNEPPEIGLLYALACCYLS